MTEKSQNGMKGMQCSQFEALLADVLDDVRANAGADANSSIHPHRLSVDVSRDFHAHAEACPVCGPIFAEAQQGMLWLQALEEVEPPVNLLHNILAATTAAEAATEPALAQATPPTWAVRWWKAVRTVVAAALQPRFAASFSMAFFSLSLTLTLAGVKFKDLTRFDWRPSSLGKAVMIEYTQVESKVVRYYRNMRLVYEIESRVGELRKNSGADEKNQPTSDQPDQPKNNEKKKDNNDTSGPPQQRQDNYSQETEDAAIAYLTPSNEGANP